ncbi:uncharacterized protein LOC129718254 isoform X2 [Wyeomyia smithii]|uniref:uncharacterized protein LOC129718254 isoform X2 n=1 Tax=Wyeomyia smithii TaxID=174621 RepID=UPI0024680182|nr:uncharacterized protein LOC129718254 isoform X2 [Wyeomyia smithii]
MAEMSPSAGGTGAGGVPPAIVAQQQQGPPVPAVRTSSLQQPVPPPRTTTLQTTTQAVVHHSAPTTQYPSAPSFHQQQQQQQMVHQQQQPHLQPQVIIAAAAAVSASGGPSSHTSIPAPNNNQIYPTSTGLLSGPRLVVLHRHNGDFGFTLRHFIVYPPPEATSDPNVGRLAAAVGMPNFAQPMESVFVKKVHPNSQAFLAGLQEGDRLLAVNSISVASLPYAQVVATIQQTPKTLTLQVVPKNYDILQTYFSETAYNPETNQRPQPQQLFIPKASSTPNSRTGQSAKRGLTDVQEKQESLYSTLQEIVGNAAATNNVPRAAAATTANNASKAIYAEVPKIRSPPVASEAPILQQQQQQRSKPLVFDFDPIKQQQYLAQQQKLLQHSKDNDSISSYDSIKSAATLSANDVLMGGGDSAIMSRLRKSFEQKEEFLRRPAPVPLHSAPFDVQQREFYARPNRLQKSVWPPPAGINYHQPQHNHHQQQQHQLMPVITTTNEQDSLSKPTKMSFGTQTTSVGVPSASKANHSAASREQHTTHLSTIREQFFSGINGIPSSQQQQQQQQQEDPSHFGPPPKSAHPSLTVVQNGQQPLQQQNQLSGSQSALPLSPHSMHVVSEKAKLFESGRPLSPDGIDRAELYKSELSRINTKQVVPNVAVRRKEFELKAESTGWRRSTEEKPRSISSDSDCRRTPVRVRSLSVESGSAKDPTILYADRHTSSDDQQLPTGAAGGGVGCSLLRQRPVRENSYRNAVRNSTAFWLQGPATSGAFVPPPSALSPPPSSVSSPPPTSLPFVVSQPSSSSSPPVPPARTYAAAHRLQPLSEEQFRLRMLHRNQTIVEVHSQPRAERSDEGADEADDDDDEYDDGDIDMKSFPSYSPSCGGSTSTTASTGIILATATPASAVNASSGTASATTASTCSAAVAAAVRPTTLNLCSDSGQVVLRQKQQHPNQALAIEEDERKTRRISYLRATAHDNLFQLMESSDPSDSSPMSLPPDTPDTEPEAIGTDQQSSSLSPPSASSVPVTDSTAAPSVVGQPTHQLQQQQFPQQLKSHSAKSKALTHFRDSPADPSVPVLREGELNIKVTLIDGKRSQDRSWRTVHAELRGTRLRLTLIRDGKSSSQSPEPAGIIDLTNFHVAEGNYTKRKNVFKLTTVSPYHQQSYHQQQQQPMSAQSHQHLALHHTQSAAGGLVGLAHTGPSSASSSGATSLYKGYERELLLQADSHNDMRLWMDSLRTVCRSSQYLNSSDYVNSLGGQQAEPQRVAAQTSVQSTASTDEFSPVLPAKSHRKYALGSRSPSGQSPVNKSRKTPQQNSAAVLTPAAIANANNNHSHHSGKDSSDKETGSPKSKTWKGIVARQFRKMQGQPGSPGAQHAEMLLPDGASINVPLPLCPPSDENPYVPLLLAKCTGIVETRGLGVTGIYRIPGNTAAISQLTEQVNRGMDEVTLKDPKWEDVNVVSSLLKSFIRNLPEPLLPNELYHSFICADKLSGQARLIELKQLLKRIPTYNYETLKHLMRHLHAVSTNALVNLMDPRNLAIVFGPSVVRSANESLETAVKDMKHQCQIVEVLINHYQYFFEDDLLPIVVEKQSASVVDSGLEVPSTSLLLDNVSKLEPFKESSKESSSHFVAQIVQAANRKIRRTAQRKSTMSSTTPDTLSLDSTTSAESKERSSQQPHHRYLHPNSASAVGASNRNGNHDGSQSDPAPVSTGVVHHSSDEGHKEQQVLQHHHHHHHYYHRHGNATGGSGSAGAGSESGSGASRHHSSQSQDDNSSVLNRSSEEDSNDSAFADNGSMSLKTITITLDNKLRSLRTSSIDSDRDVADTTALESDGDNSSSCYSTAATPGSTVGGGVTGSTNQTPTRRSVHSHSRPLTLGENIPYADESPERPLIQPRAKPLRQHSNSNGNFPRCTEVSNSNGNLVNNNINNNNNNHNGNLQDESVKLSQKSLDSGGGTANGSANDSCVTLVNESHAPPEDVLLYGEDEEDKVNNISISSDDTDTSTTSNPREKLTAAAYRIDTEVLKKMNRILTNLERKANNLERKFNLNRSLSLNYKNHKNLECCCGHAVATIPGTTAGTPGATIPVHQCCNNNMHSLHSNNNNNNNAVSVNNGLNVRSRLSLTKDEKTDKNINRRRQIHDVSQTVMSPVGIDGCCGQQQTGSLTGPQIILTPQQPQQQQPTAGRHRRQLGNRSIRRRHTVGGTHDYYSSKTPCPQQQQQQQQQTGAIVPQQAICGGDDKGCKDLD